MSKRAATPVRFDAPVAERLASFAAANPGMSLSSAANRLVDEALRMSEHPGIMFRPGPTGRRAALAGGPDVWEVVRAVKSARVAEPELADDGLLGLVADNGTGRPIPRKSTPRSPLLTPPSTLPSKRGSANTNCSPGNR